MKRQASLFSKLTVALAVVLAVGVAAGTAQAVPVALDTLLRGGTITVDDKVFSNFTFSISGNVNPANPALINVNGISNDPLHQTLQFSGPFSGGCTTCPAGTGDILIGYTVTTTNQLPLIHDIALSFNGIVVNPTASVTVTETAFVGLTPVGNIFVSNPPVNLFATMVLDGGPYVSVSVLKDIQFQWGAGGRAEISAINQTISQVPEPTSVLLLGSGLAAFGLWGMKRRKSA